MAQGHVPGQPLPGAAPIAAVCRRAGAHNHGSTLAGEPAIGPAGVRVRLSSWPRQQEALQGLRALGYRAAAASWPGEHGAALLVTGWSARLLTARVERLETAVRHLECDASIWAECALVRFRGLTGEDGLDEDTARDRVVAETRSAAAAQPGPPHVHVPAEYAEHDRRQAHGVIRVLLGRAAAGEHAVAHLARNIKDLAEAVIGLLLEYRYTHGYDKESATAWALLGIGEGTQVIRQLAGHDIDRGSSESA
jgi:hypothetical protein